MESKQNDLMLNILENPSFSISDFQNVGLNADNTSLESESTYASSPIIQNNPLFQTPTGQFDNAKFHQTYLGAQQAYNYLATEPNKDFTPVFSKYNIFAPMEQRNWNPEFKVTKVSNPDLITKGLIRIGENGPREKSREEIAQTQKVFDVTTGQWLDAPNDDFFGQLSDTRILAQYDKDVDVNGIERGQKGFDENRIEHVAGEYKLNENGTYYYETAGGRNIYGKQVLHMSDILTTDGSAMNAIDFFDSDGIDKSPIGSFVKNAALIGAMFIPGGVGAVVTGATVLQQALGLGATLGKIALGSDNPTMNYLEGLSESTNFMNTRSEYSKEHTWSIENLLGMVGDTVGQLRQQRMLFKYLPAIVKGTSGISEKGQEALQAKYLKELNAATKASLSKYKSGAELAAAIQKQEAMNSIKAASQLENYMKDYYNIGGVLSKAYMTMLTVNDIYGEALEAGASDTDAALLTAGYAAAEYALLSTGLGEWILPELRAARQRARGVAKALTKEALENFDKMKAAATTPEAKRNYLRRVLQWGKKIAHADYAVGTKGTEVVTEAAGKGFGISRAGMKSVFAGALGEATEETSEELLADFQRSIFNAIQEAKGTNVRLKPWENWQDRYAMSFLGGFLGGGISAATIDYKQAKSYANMSYNQAIQEVIQMDRNDELKDLYKILDKETIGNVHLSATKMVKDDNGNIIGWDQGDKNDNQDLDIKNRVRTQLRLIHDTLNSSGAYASDDELLANNLDILKDLRYNALRNTTSAGKFLQEFNRLGGLYVEKALELKNLNSPETKAEVGEGDQKDEKNPDLEQRRADLQKEMEDLKVQIEEMRSGKKAPLFMANALIESTPFISKALMPSTYKYFVEAKEGKKWEDLSPETQNKYIDDWNNYQKTDMKDDVSLATHGYLSTSRMFSAKFAEIQAAAQAIIDNESLQEFLNQQSAFLNTMLEGANMLNIDLSDPKIQSILLAQGITPDSLSADSWTETLQNEINSKTISPEQFKAQITLLTNTYRENLEQMQKELQDAEELRDSGRLEDSEFEALKNRLNFGVITDDYINTVTEYIKRTIYDPTENIVKGFLKSKSINGAVKDQVLASLKGVADVISKIALEVSSQIEDLSGEYGDPDIMTGIDPYVLNHSLEDLDLYKLSTGITEDSDDGSNLGLYSQLKNLSYTPIMDILDNFVLNITSQTGGQFKISDLISHLTSLYQQAGEDISQFSIDNKDALISLKEAIQAIDLLEAVVEGARDDTLRFDTQFSASLDAMRGGKGDKTNLWGINVTLNEVHRKAPKPEMDDWEDLPVISGQLADMILQDISLVKKQLEFYGELFAINSGQKINKQTRVSTNINYILYSKLKKFVTDVVPDDWDKSALEEAIANATTLESLIEDKPLGISSDLHLKVEKERIMLETAIHDFFNSETNREKFESVEELAKLLQADKFNLFTEHSSLLNESSEDMDDIAFISWLSSKAAINSNIYHRGYKELLAGSNRAPFASQEIGTYLHVANVVNGDVISRFQEATRKSMLDYYRKLDFDRKKKLMLKMGNPDGVATLLATKSGNKYIRLLSCVPSFSNITFVEGIPGAGKSEAVNRFMIRYLQAYSPERLSNAWVVHVDEKTAENYGKNIGLAEGSYQSFDRASLMKETSSDWKDFELNESGDYTIKESEYKVTEDGEIVPVWKLKEPKNIPSIIIIDEVSRFTKFDLIHLNNFAKKYGISIVTTGDLDQSQAQGEFTFPEAIIKEANKELTESKITFKDDRGNEQTKFKGFYFLIQIERNQLMRAPKLGTSLRTANSQKTKNLVTMQAVVSTLMGNLALKYYQDDTHLYGDKTYAYGDRKTQSLSDNAKKKIVEDIKNRIIPNLAEGEKIGFIYFSKESNLYKLVMGDSQIASHIEEYQGNAAQGKEGNYWIIEVNPNKDTKPYLQDLYTGITRAKEASIIIAPGSIKGISDNIEISSEAEPNTQTESLPEDAVVKYSEKIKRIYDAIVGEGSTDPGFKERTKDDSVTVVTDDPKSDEEIDNEEDTEEDKEDLEERRRKEEEEKERKRREEEEEARRKALAEKITARETAAKETEEFVLPEGVKISKVGNKITLSEAIPVSILWFKKYFGKVETDSNLLNKEVYYIKQASVNPDGSITTEVLNDGVEEQSLGLITSPKETLIGEMFNNNVDLTDPDPTEGDVEVKRQKAIELFEATKNFRLPEGVTVKYDIDSKGNTVVTFVKGGRAVDIPLSISFIGSLAGANIDFSEYTEEELDDFLEAINNNINVKNIIISKDNTKKIRITLSDGNQREFTEISSYDIFNGLITEPVKQEHPVEISPAKPAGPVIETEEDEPVISGNEVMTDEQKEEFLSRNNKRTNYGSDDEPDVDDAHSKMGEKHGGDSHLKQLLYSNATFEFGAEIHPKSDSYEDPKHSKRRIDSINGLIRVKKIQDKLKSPSGIFALQGKKGSQKPINDIKSLSDMERVLGEFRGMALHTEDKAKLEEYFQRQLGLSNIYCRFAIKNYSTEDTTSKGPLEKTNKWYLKFYRSVKEKLLHNRSGSKKGDETGKRRLVIIIGSKQTIGKDKVIGDVLEIPLLALNNPISVLLANKDNSNVYGRMYKAYSECIERELAAAGISKKDPNYEEARRELQPKALRAARHAANDKELMKNSAVAYAIKVLNDEGLKEGTPEYKDRKKQLLGDSGEAWKHATYTPQVGAQNLCNLIDLYLNTDRNIFYQDDPNWTVAKDLICYGPQLNISRGEFSENPDYEQSQSMINLDRFAEDPTLKVSRIMVATSGQYELGDGTVIKGFVSQPGHPFVLYSDDPTLKTDKDLISAFVEQQKAKKAKQGPWKPRVKLAYVIGPQFTFDEYLDSLIGFVTKVSPTTLGNIRTPLEVLNALMFDADGNENPELLQLFKEIWDTSKNPLGEKYYNEVKELITDILYKDGKPRYYANQVEMLKENKSKGLMGFNNRSVASQLQNVIKQLIQNSSIDLVTGESDVLGKPSPEHRELLKELFKRSGKKLYETARLGPKTENGVFAYVKVQKGQDGKYKIDNNGRCKNQYFMIRGNLSSSMYVGTDSFNKWIDEIINGKWAKGKKRRVPKTKKLQYYSNGGSKSTDNEDYLAGHSWFTEGEQPKTSKTSEGEELPKDPVMAYSAIIDKALEALADIDPDIAEEIKEHFPPKSERDDSIEIKKSIAEALNLTPGNIGLVVQQSGKSYIFRGKVPFTENVQIGSVILTNKDTAGTYNFEITVGDTVYNASLDSNFNLVLTPPETVSETPLKVVAQPIVKVIPDNLQTWKNLMKKIPPQQIRIPFVAQFNNFLRAGDIEQANTVLEENSERFKKAFSKIQLQLSDLGESQIFDSIINYESIQENTERNQGEDVKACSVSLKPIKMDLFQ